jgi:hypothetical protein
MPEITDLLDVNIEDLSPEQHQQLVDAVNQFQQKMRRKISSEDSAEVLAVGRLLPFGKGTVCADFAGSHGDVARAEGMNGWISIRIWAIN